MVSKNPQKIQEDNGKPSLPTGPKQAAKTEIMGSLDLFRAAYLFTFGPRGQGNSLRGSSMVSKNPQIKYRGNQWYAQSAHCAHTGHIKGNVGSLDAPIADQLFIWP